MPSIWRLVMVAMIERDNTTWPEGLPKELEDFFYEVKFVEVEAVSYTHLTLPTIA